MPYDSTRALQLLRAGSGRNDATFREGQEGAIRHVVEGHGRLLVVQKTGWGKSFVYFKFVPVYVRSTGELSTGLKALQSKGARLWPNPENADALAAVFEVASEGTPSSSQAAPSLFDQEISEPVTTTRSHGMAGPPGLVTQQPDSVAVSATSDALAAPVLSTESDELPADQLFGVVRTLLQQLLRTLKKESEVAAALNVSASQAKAWLHRLVDEGVLEVRKRPAGYIVKQDRLFK